MKLAEYGQAALASALDVDPATLPGDAGVSMRVVPLPVPFDDPRDLQAEISDRLGVEVSVPKWNGQNAAAGQRERLQRPGRVRQAGGGIRSLL